MRGWMGIPGSVVLVGGRWDGITFEHHYLRHVSPVGTAAFKEYRLSSPLRFPSSFSILILDFTLKRWVGLSIFLVLALLPL